MLQKSSKSQNQTNGIEIDHNDQHSNRSGTDRNREPPIPILDRYLPLLELHIFPTVNSGGSVITEEIIPDLGEETVPFSEEAVEAVHAIKEVQQAEVADQENIAVVEVVQETEAEEECQCQKKRS